MNGQQVEADFRAYVIARQGVLRRAACLLTGDAALADDLVQSALIRCWPRWSRVCVRGDPDAYVRRTMVNTLAGWRRRRWTAEVPSERLPDQPAPQVESEVRATVAGALLRLPPRQRAAVVFRFLDDLSEQQTADALGCSVGTVKSQTSRALARLRQDPTLTALLLVEDGALT